MVSNFRAILSLTRLWLSLMVTFSAMVGFYFADNFNLRNWLFLTSGVFLLAAGTSALNQFQEFKPDGLMTRTRNRALVTGSISKTRALALSIGLMLVGTLLLAATGIAAPLLGLLNIVLYNFIYTPLKAKTSLAIIPGALVGAVPPLMGWSAAGASLMLPGIWFIAIFMFLWQLPHFWLLLMEHGKDYEKAGFKCLPGQLSGNQIRTIVFFWTVITSGFLFLFPIFDIEMNLLQKWVLIFVNLFFIAFFHHLLFGSETKPRSAFIVLNSYMAVILLFFVWLVA
jgi:protoheme IX farnesyltransferase